MRMRILGLLLVLIAVLAGCDTGDSDDPCREVECGAGGSCAVQQEAAVCLCPAGFVADGLACVADPCAAGPCVHGTCRALGAEALCVCQPGYTGAYCDSCAPGYHADGLSCLPGSPCTDDPCIYGVCVELAGVAACECELGYAGRWCDACAEGYHAVDLRCVSDTPCDPDPCVHGVCEAGSGLPECRCDPGYDGRLCDECASGYHEEELICVPDVGGPCDPNPCAELHRTMCAVVGADFECRCDPGYRDSDGTCQPITACDPNPCQEPLRTVCQADGAGGFQCLCDAGYHEEGDECLADTACSPNPCSTVHRTVCVDLGGGDHRCDCDPGTHEEAGVCLPDTACSPNPCQQAHRTVCALDGGGYLCRCDPAYHDEAGACVPDTTCDPATTCSGHGSCTGTGLECACDAGYSGSFCEGCDGGYHADGSGGCLPDTLCDPNPCTTVHRTACVDLGGSFRCDCDAGYQDADGNGSCLADCATAAPACVHGACGIVAGAAVCVCETGYSGALCAGCAAGYQDHDSDGVCRPSCATSGLVCDPLTCDDSSGEALCVGARSCAVTLRYDPQGTSITALYVRGEFNSWDLSDPLTRGGDGSWTISLEAEPGDYAYKLYDQGRDQWFEDPGNPYFKWVSNVRNSRLRVPDCDLPLLQLVAQPTVSSGRVQFAVRYVDGAQLAGVDAASARVTRNGTTLGGTFDPASGLFSIDDTGLANGKVAYRFEAADLAGRTAEPLFVPLWVEDQPFAWEDAVLYFVLTDRFANGTTANDAPTANVDAKANWQGGDLAGLLQVIESGYFESLGVNTLWLSSVTQNTAGAGAGSDGRNYSGYHSYWPIATGWRDDAPLSGVQPVDPHFGDLTALRAVVRAAHARGIRVLTDFVANHVHSDSPLWTQHQSDSPPWFHLPVYVCGWDQPITCWFASYLPDFEYKTQAVLDTVVEHAVWLVEEAELDGFRLDAVKHMIHDLGFALRARLTESVGTTDLRFYMVGETFTGEDGGPQIREYVHPEELDGQFDFPLYWQVVKTFLREEQDFRPLESMLQANWDYYGAWAVMSNFLGNHDVCRALSHAAGQIADMWGNGSKEQGWTNPPPLPTEALPYQRLRLAWTFLMTIKGVPLIYYGDEFGMEGAGDPDNRKFMRFDDQLIQPQRDTLTHVQRLGAARRAHPALRRGSRTQLYMEGNGSFWAYGRVSGSDRAVVVFNRSTAQATRSIPVTSIGMSNGAQLHDVVHDTNATVSGGALSVTLAAHDSAVFVLP